MDEKKNDCGIVEERGVTTRFEWGNFLEIELLSDLRVEKTPLSPSPSPLLVLLKGML